MANAATGVRIAADTIFWAEVRGAFERIAADPQESARQKAEIELWDKTSDRDFKDEVW